MNARIRAGLIFGLLLWSILQAGPQWAQNRQTRSTVRFGLAASVIESDVNPNDALAAAKVWADLLGKGTGLWNAAEARIFPEPSALLSAVNSGDADIVAMATNEYLEIEKKLQAIPSFTFVLSGHIESQFLILVRNDSGIRTIKDLRNKRIALPKGGRSTLLPIWLDVLLYENGLADKESFFREMKQAQKNSQAILPVFFKQMDAGATLASTFETTVALNPQVGQQLRVLVASPKLVTQVTCIRSTLPIEMRQEYLKQALKLHESPSGLQGFHLFKLERLVPWSPAYTDNVRELLRKRKLALSAPALNARADFHTETGMP